MDRALLETTLARQLAWITAADNKISPVLTLSTAMVAGVAAVAPAPGQWSWYGALAAALTLTGLVICLGHVFAAAFPRITGPSKSLVFFGGITERSEEEFISEIGSTSADEYDRDLARQCFRNAEIAGQKYGHVKKATRAMLLSVGH